MTTTTVRTDQRFDHDERVVAVVRRALLRIADHEDALAAEEAAEVRYWEPQKASVIARRTAATALRLEADLVVGTGSLSAAG
jgi:hypothetical protein